MDSAVFLDCLAAALAPEVLALGGRLEVATDPDHVIEMLADAPSKFRVILNWAGEEAVDPDNSPGIVYFSLGCTVQVAQGMTLENSAVVYKTSANGRQPLLTLSGLMSQRIRGFSGHHPDLSDGFKFVSRAFLSIEGLNARQILTTHRCVMALDDVIDTPCVFPLPAESV